MRINFFTYFEWGEFIPLPMAISAATTRAQKSALETPIFLALLLSHMVVSICFRINNISINFKQKLNLILNSAKLSCKQDNEVLFGFTCTLNFRFQGKRQKV